MPGIVGFVNHRNIAQPDLLLMQMARALEPEELFKVNPYLGDGVGFARVSLEVLNPEQQPIWNEDQTKCVVFEGELYDSEHIKRELVKRGHWFSVENDAELILHLYEEYGDEFPIKLNGAFIAAIWDQTRMQLLIVNDRLGLYPLYYSQCNGDLLFGCGVRAILASPFQKHTVDQTAIAEFLTFDHLLDDRTLVEEIRLLPQGSILRYTEGELKICSYWMPQYPVHYPLHSENEYIEQFQYYMRQAVERQIQGDSVVGLLLSGGLDSRVLLAYMSQASGKEVHSFTWGIPGCNDVRYAVESSRRAGVRHHFYNLRSDWLLEKAISAVRITDGMGNLVNLHALATLEEETRHSKIIYKGFLGDAMMGYGLRSQFWGEYGSNTDKLVHMSVHLDQGIITVAPEEQRLLFTDSFQKHVSSQVADAYNDAMEAANTPSLADQRNYFDFRQRVPRMTIRGVEVVRSRAMARLPFCDNDLVEFSLRVPPGLRYNRRLVKDAFVREFPHLAQIPITETGYPMMVCTRDVLMHASRVIRYGLMKRGLGWLVSSEKRTYQNYGEWFRTNLRGWMEEILLSSRAMERGYFNPEYVRNLVSEHISGINHTVCLGALLSLELWHREFID